MSRVHVQIEEIGRCQARHEESGATLVTEISPAYGGSGQRFSSTDLVAAALGTCIGSSIDRVADRAGLPLSALSIEVEKSLSSAPRRIARLAVTVRIAAPVDPATLTKLERASHACVVHRSLHPETEVSVRFVPATAPTD